MGHCLIETGISTKHKLWYKVRVHSPRVIPHVHRRCKCFYVGDHKPHQFFIQRHRPSLKDATKPIRNLQSHVWDLHTTSSMSIVCVHYTHSLLQFVCTCAYKRMDAHTRKWSWGLCHCDLDDEVFPVQVHSCWWKWLRFLRRWQNLNRCTYKKKETWDSEQNRDDVVCDFFTLQNA